MAENDPNMLIDQQDGELHHLNPEQIAQLQAMQAMYGDENDDQEYEGEEMEYDDEMDHHQQQQN